ncbi:MAG: hypothetical protein ACE5KP_04530 [Dehalococcoidales bacterium]
MEERLIKKLMASMKCESCGQNYEVYNIDIIGHREDMWFLRVLCSVCHTQCLVAAVVKEGEKPGTVTDLTETELNESKDKLIEAEDVLVMHHFLKDFDGDFSRLFGPE